MGGNLSFPEADLKGKVAIVTGGNAGIGYETAKGIARLGARTIIACRSEEKATAAIERMKAEITATGSDQHNIEFMKLDLSSFNSTDKFVASFKEKQLPLHILINNAGTIGSSNISKTDDGFESMFQINHLSHFLLTLELLPVMLRTAESCKDCRIVIVSSTAHKSGVLDTQNMNGEVSFSRLKFYSNSKLYNVMHAFALQRRLKGSDITVSVLHPGFVNSELFEKGFSGSSGGSTAWSFGKYLFRPIMRDTVKGAATTINCAVNPELNTKECHYYDSCKIVDSIPLSMNTDLQEQLWDISVTNVKAWLSSEIVEKYCSVPQQTGLEETKPETHTTGANTGERSATVKDDSTTKEESTGTKPETQATGANTEERPATVKDDSTTKEESTGLEEPETQTTGANGERPATVTDDSTTKEESTGLEEAKPETQATGANTEERPATVKDDSTTKEESTGLEETKPETQTIGANTGERPATVKDEPATVKDDETNQDD